jgi:hypothetical protein
LAWGYYPRQVVGKRAASLTREKSKGLGVLLGFAAVIAAVLMFAIVSEIMAPPDTEDEAASDVETEAGPDGGPSLIEGENIKTRTGTREEGKTYAEYKGKPKKKQRNLSSWERFKAEEEERERALRGEKLTEQEREHKEGMD